MTHHFPIVIEREANGTCSAWVAGLPGVYAAADSPRQRTRVRFVGIGALLGRTTSPAKAAAARLNGRKGGRPRKAVQLNRYR